jgi:hypothetical protein
MEMLKRNDMLEVQINLLEFTIAYKSLGQYHNRVLGGPRGAAEEAAAFAQRGIFGSRAVAISSSGLIVLAVNKFTTSQDLERLE